MLGMTGFRGAFDCIINGTFLLRWLINIFGRASKEAQLSNALEDFNRVWNLALLNETFFDDCTTFWVLKGAENIAKLLKVVCLLVHPVRLQNALHGWSKFLKAHWSYTPKWYKRLLSSAASNVWIVASIEAHVMQLATKSRPIDTSTTSQAHDKPLANERVNLC